MKVNSEYFYINGRLLKSNKAAISVLDIGLLRGFGIFDFLVTYKNRPFLVDEHINRLFNSARLIDLDIGKSKIQIKKIILSALQKNNDGFEKTIRIVVTGGVGENSLKPANNSTIVLIVQNKHDYPNKFYHEGIKLITYEYVRPVAFVKSLDYSTAVRALKLARSKNALEALYIDKANNSVSEATTSNVFVVKNGKIYTPENNVLGGITRNLVIELQKKINPVILKDIPIKDIYSADEIFITASNKEVMPVVRIDSKKIGNGKVGPITRSVMKSFRDFIESGNWKLPLH